MSSNKVFKNLPPDGSNKPMPVGRELAFADVTGTPVASPVTVTAVGTGVTTLNAPTNSVEIKLTSAIDVRFSTTDATLAAAYYVIPAGTTDIFGIGASETVYIAGDSEGGDVSFAFTTV